jgi:hypothetical protein
MRKELQPTNIKDGRRVPVMHGENWFMPVDKAPEGAYKRTKKFVAGHSESGHNHVLVSDKPFEAMEAAEKHDLFVRLFEPTELKHQKSFDVHETQVLAPGDYAVYHKTEYDPVTEQRRKVYD